MFRTKLRLITFFIFCGISSISSAGYNSSKALMEFENQSLGFHLLGEQYLSSSLSKSLQPKLKTQQTLAAKSKKPLVFLLGGGPGFSSWNLQPIQENIVSWGYPVVLMDMAGIGENKHLIEDVSSGLNKSLPVQLWVRQIHAVVTHLAPQQKLVLVGHSWGGLMAMLYLRAYPEGADKVILLNPVDPEKKAMQNLTAEIDLRNRQETEISWDDESAWEQKTEVQASEIDRITLRQIQQVLPTYFLDYDLGKNYASQFTVNDFNIDLNIAAWKEYDANPIKYSEMNATAAQFYFMECKQDYLMPYNQQAIEAKLRLQQSVVLDQCGHFPWIEKETEFYQTLKEFLDESL